MFLLAVWQLSANHCYLETAGVFPEDDCHIAQEQNSGSGDPCDAGCKLVEKAGYKNQGQQKIQPLLLFFVSTIQFFNLPPVVSGCPQIRFWPPDTLSLPQFVMTTALPVRAPSFVS